ncbi:MAG: hypothetical protein K0V04_08815 [Deltaproteobacteria bacterium]|nr:hypothetical protein [Deltaproteobacteria bacterium]
MVLVAVRFIDIAIFCSLGALWVGGIVFIAVLYRWIVRFEREERDRASSLAASVEATPVPAPGRKGTTPSPSRRLPAGQLRPGTP